MNRHQLSIALTIMCISVLSSCGETDRQEVTTLFGEWRLVAIHTELNGIPDIEGGDNEFDCDVYYTFNQDSTYVIQDGDNEIFGTWNLNDSTLTISSNEPASVSTCYLVKLRNDSLIHKSITDSEYGQIVEYMTLVKIRNKYSKSTNNIICK